MTYPYSFQIYLNLFSGKFNYATNQLLWVPYKDQIHHQKADLDIFTHTIHELQQQLNDDNKETYIMGDMNIDLI